jgi:hypothetical protein
MGPCFPSTEFAVYETNTREGAVPLRTFRVPPVGTIETTAFITGPLELGNHDDRVYQQDRNGRPAA